MYRYFIGLCSLMVWSAVFSVPSEAQTANNTEAILATMDRLLINLPMSVAGRDPLKRFLDELSRERCDQQAIADLGVALDKLGYRREAATAQVSYSATCGGHAPSLRAAVNILLRLSDYPTAVTVASNLIKLEPFYDNGYYLRAVAYDRSGSFKKAIDDYITAIELFGNKDRIARSSANSVTPCCPSKHGYP
jgi:tetratricopeptide (TPR) repeat protein